MRDMLSERQTEEEPPARFNRRRLIRWAVILTIGTLSMLAVWQDPLYP
ncbi:hypothetical protein Acy02nite_37950 [Actinoplanes cyaneus]|jgi:hypothetical protein|uniref:Uncharacterized protein n=1 Tax=Actinoplanes cyaneus TaxID=52696 RepID=A0A919M7Y6_9ACTN|nr:hypothetical protein [Actinoplanes cyaneus]MCW2139383.1 hypothetical protein [Actinoplanes cyaneus]GID65914.1 hypothetical protein Acy02nite_37950 [Actinoplanes cyaneus]